MLYWSMATISDSPANSSSPRSSPLSFPSSSPIPTSSGAAKKKSMEEVWSDISLSYLNHPSNGSTSVSATKFGLTLHEYSSVQDFLSRPPKGKQRTSACPGHSAGQGGRHSQPVKGSGSGFFAYEKSRVAPMFSLDTRMKIHCAERSQNPSRVEPQLHPTRKSHDAFVKAAASCSCSRLDPLDYSSPVEFPILCKKRCLESDDSASDHRNNRLMKNRESAARSRARKQVSSVEKLLIFVKEFLSRFQPFDAMIEVSFPVGTCSKAYTYELELKVSQLVEENGRLKRQLEEHCIAATPAQYPKKHTLQRTLTAPF